MHNKYTALLRFTERENDFVKNRLREIDDNRSIKPETKKYKVFCLGDGKILKGRKYTAAYYRTFEKFKSNKFYLSHDSIQAIHKSLNGHIHTHNPGKYRNGNEDHFGVGIKTELGIFEYTPPNIPKQLMGDLITWTSSELAKGEMHPILIMIVFAYEFVSIHPFSNGNGRTQRMLLMLLLYKHGYRFVESGYLENVINERYDLNYLLTARCQQKRGKPDESVNHLAIYLLAAMCETIKRINRSALHPIQCNEAVTGANS